MEEGRVIRGVAQVVGSQLLLDYNSLQEWWGLQYLGKDAGHSNQTALYVCQPQFHASAAVCPWNEFVSLLFAHFPKWSNGACLLSLAD